MSLPVIAIVGRPNVGKSTLFNRLIGKRYAITSPIPGTTRDRIYHEAELGTYRVIMVDTGGMEFEKKKDIEADVQLQAKIAIEEANIIFFVLDGTEPLTSNDLDCARHLRRSKKPIILIANKADRKRIAEAVSELYELGLGDPVQISSIHNFGISELEEALEKVLKKMKWSKDKPHNKKVIHMAIVGKPNVGKSSLVNALLSKNRLIVSDKPGTTIDATDTPIKRDGKDYVLIDTAGLRRRGKVKGLERFGVMRALQAISRSDVTCLVLDWGTGIANQDMHVSEYVLESGKGLIILVNKADLMTDPHGDQTNFLAHMQRRMPYIPWAPVLFISTISKKNIFKIFEMGRDIAEEMNKKIEDDLFNLFTKTTVLAHPPMRGGHNIIISKGQQTDVFPPTFTFFANKPDIIHFSYRRFLENEIRRKFGFYGTAIRVEFKPDWHSQPA
ncbi:ribosome biogenesis GTPase Der [Candidatus Peregrinibacteria bacterium]|nr:ribosome biogenesis GTPase Der [Candidatus Peregrinibacteria bacterium]